MWNKFWNWILGCSWWRFLFVDNLYTFSFSHQKMSHLNKAITHVCTLKTTISCCVARDQWTCCAVLRLLNERAVQLSGTWGKLLLAGIRRAGNKYLPRQVSKSSCLVTWQSWWKRNKISASQCGAFGRRVLSTGRSIIRHQRRLSESKFQSGTKVG